MIKSKFVAIACAATLAVAPGLVACGGSSSSDASNTDPATEQTTEEATEVTSVGNAEAETSDSDDIVVWGAEGVSDDLKYAVLYVETRNLTKGYNMAQLLLVDFEASKAKNYHGEFTEDGNGTITLMDTMSGDTVTYTTSDVNPETNEVKMTVDGVGTVTLTPIEDVDTVRDDIVDAIKANDEA